VAVLALKFSSLTIYTVPHILLQGAQSLPQMGGGQVLVCMCEGVDV
jgi:hypothetical protein